MNAEAERHLKALDSLIAIHHADTGQEAVKALAGIIRNLETEAATATTKLDNATATIEGYAKDVGYEGPDTKADFSKHLKELVERNQRQAEYFDKLCKVTGSPSHDLDELVKDVRALKSAKEMIETYRDDWRAQSWAKDAELKEIREDRDDWRERAERQLAENERLVAEFAAATQERDRIAREMIAAQQQSQPQPPNSYLAKEIDRLEAEAVAKDHQIETLKRELQEERDATRNRAIFHQSNATLRAVAAAEQAHQPDPAAEISRLKAEEVIAGNRIKELKLELEKERSLRRKLEETKWFSESLKYSAGAEDQNKSESACGIQPLPCHTFQTYQPDPLADRISHLEREWRIHTDQIEALLNDLRAARDEANSLRAERDRYAKIIDRL